MRRSVVDRKNWYSSFHRFVYGHGWSAAAAFAIAAVVCFPFALWPCAIVASLAIGAAAVSAWTEFLEAGMRALKRQVRLNELVPKPEHYGDA